MSTTLCISPLKHYTILVLLYDYDITGVVGERAVVKAVKRSKE